jgi:hypothetical protein
VIRRPPSAGLSTDERRAYVQLADQNAKHLAYSAMMSTRPQTLYGMADSPVSLASWLLDHGDGDDQPAAAIVSALHGTHEHLTRDDVIDNITLYWLTNTGVSANRFYWDTKFRVINAADISVPAAVSVSPARSTKPPAAGPNGRTTTSSTSTTSPRAATSRPGNSPASTPPRSDGFRPLRQS